MSTNAPPAAGLERALHDILADALAPGDGAHAVDGLTPSWVATPSSVEQLAATLAAADQHGAAVIPWGGGRHMALGNAPSRYAIALRTTKLDRVLEYEPADLTVAVEAGITMGRLQALLGEHGQFLPIDAPTGATVGGVLAAGVSGPSRHAYGLPRDWLIGCRFVLADGTIVKGGGRVVKNVAGYDLPKLVIGSLGTLGVIVEATFKVAPLPPVQETLVAQFDSLAAAGEAVFAADERGLALRAVALLDEPNSSPIAAFWLAGPASAVERTRRELTELATGAQVQRLEAEASSDWWAALDALKAGADTVLQASLPPSRVIEFMERWHDEAGALAYPTTGVVLMRLDGGGPIDRIVAAVESARRAALDAGGSLIVTAAPPGVKARVDVWGETDALPLMRRLKEQFDPNGTLSPGRFVGGI